MIFLLIRIRSTAAHSHSLDLTGLIDNIDVDNLCICTRTGLTLGQKHPIRLMRSLLWKIEIYGQRYESLWANVSDPDHWSAFSGLSSDPDPLVRIYFDYCEIFYNVQFVWILITQDPELQRVRAWSVFGFSFFYDWIRICTLMIRSRNINLFEEEGYTLGSDVLVGFKISAIFGSFGHPSIFLTQKNLGIILINIKIKIIFNEKWIICNMAFTTFFFLSEIILIHIQINFRFLKCKYGEWDKNLFWEQGYTVYIRQWLVASKNNFEIDLSNLCKKKKNV